MATEADSKSLSFAIPRARDANDTLALARPGGQVFGSWVTVRNIMDRAKLH
jgi:hypothetical protein